jgi:predicted ester cyclase
MFTEGNLDAVDRYLHPAFVNHDPPFPGAPEGSEGMRMAAAMFRAALPDWGAEFDQLVAEDDIVVERFHASGTHRGELMGIPGTGRTLVLHGINIWRVDGDQIVERWGQLDELGLLRQLGLAPADPSSVGSCSTPAGTAPSVAGLHSVRVAAVEGCRVLVRDLEALDGTPILDVKPVLEGGK